MIEKDVIDYLKNDSILYGLLNASGSDNKMYPVQIPHGAVVPYILYNLISDGSRDENFLKSSISFNCISSNYVIAGNIKDSITRLLDKQDKIQKLMDSDNYRYLWSKKIGGTEFKDTVLKTFYKVAIIDFKYHEAEYILTEDSEYILTEDGERIFLSP